MEHQNQNYPSYKTNRKCLHDGKPIADHVHASTKFCEKYTLPDGSIKSCKDDYHAEKNRIANQPFVDHMNFHKTMTHNISRLLTEKGATVTTADITFYEIFLDRTVRLKRPANQQSVYYFINFAFTQLTTTQFKISRHGNDYK